LLNIITKPYFSIIITKLRNQVLLNLFKQAVAVCKPRKLISQVTTVLHKASADKQNPIGRIAER
jgi:hypothetical protein